jgi:hypothetical protein
MAELDKEILALAGQQPYRTPVGWLQCFRGLSTLSAMILERRSSTSSAFADRGS